MSPWAWVKRIFGKLGADPRLERRFVVPYSVSGVNLTPDETLSLAAVWACVDVIARNIASCRWNIYQDVPGPKNRRTFLKDDPKAWMLNTRPNPEMTAIAFREAMLFQAIPFGNAYAEIQFDRGLRPIALWPLLTDRMFPQRNAATWALEYKYVNMDGSITVLPPERVYHVRGPGIWHLMGDNLVARAVKSISVAAAQERFSAAYFGQGASPQGVLEFPNKLGDDQHKRLKEDWAEKHKGPENAHKPLILESGMKFNPISFDPQKSQMVESRKFSVEEICRWFGVPPHKVQHLDHATFSNIEHSSIEFVRDALMPWACRLSQEADAKLFQQNRAPWKYTEIDLRPLTHGDAVSRSQAQASWRQNGIFSANEIRAMEGYDDVGPDGDVLLANGTLKPVEQLIAPPPPPPVALPPGQKPGDEPDGDEPDGKGPQKDPGNDKAKDVARRAVFGSVRMALDRYSKRVQHRREAKGDPLQMPAFKVAQCSQVLDELGPTRELQVIVFGRELAFDDVIKLASAAERGEPVEEAVKLLPSGQVSTSNTKV